MRGISPLIATVLLIVMTVGIAILVYAWMNNMIGGLQQSSESQAQKITLQVMFTIADARKNAAGGVDAIIYNSGSVAIDLLQAQCLLEQRDISTSSLINTYSGVCQNVTVAPNSQTQVPITFSGVTFDFTRYVYVLKITYKGVSASKTLAS